jgi:hypothetical protein
MPEMVIRFPSVFSQILYETNDKNFQLEHEGYFSIHYYIIIHKSFNHSNV